MISLYKDVRCVRISFKIAQSKLLQLDKDPGHMCLKLQLTVGETMKYLTPCWFSLFAYKEMNSL